VKGVRVAFSGSERKVIDAEFERALTLTQNARERSVLLQRIAACSARG
jgi:predicted RNA polymerase sigma factor